MMLIRVCVGIVFSTRLQDPATRLQRLEFLLKKSSAYSQMLASQMELVRANAAAQAQVRSQPSTPVKPKAKSRGKSRNKSKGGKRQLDSDDDEPSVKRAKVVVTKEVEEKPAFVQPELLTGATLRDYQLEGVAWMWSLFDQGISGILGESSSSSSLNVLLTCQFFLCSGRDGSREGVFPSMTSFALSF